MPPKTVIFLKSVTIAFNLDLCKMIINLGTMVTIAVHLAEINKSK